MKSEAPMPTGGDPNQLNGSCGTDNNAENTGITISVDANGVVTMNGTMSSYRGFMSYDKRTIVGTFTENGDTYHQWSSRLPTARREIPSAMWSARGSITSWQSAALTSGASEHCHQQHR